MVFDELYRWMQLEHSSQIEGGVRCCMIRHALCQRQAVPGRLMSRDVDLMITLEENGQ